DALPIWAATPRRVAALRSPGGADRGRFGAGLARAVPAPWPCAPNTRRCAGKAFGPRSLRRRRRVRRVRPRSFLLRGVVEHPVTFFGRPAARGLAPPDMCVRLVVGPLRERPRDEGGRRPENAVVRLEREA